MNKDSIFHTATAVALSVLISFLLFYFFHGSQKDGIFSAIESHKKEIYQLVAKINDVYNANKKLFDDINALIEKNKSIIDTSNENVKSMERHSTMSEDNTQIDGNNGSHDDVHSLDITDGEEDLKHELDVMPNEHSSNEEKDSNITDLHSHVSAS